MIDLYNGYTTDDVLRDIPFEGKSLILYPVKVYQERQFNKLLHYILYSRKHYEIDKKVKLLDYVVKINSIKYLKDNEKLSNDEVIGLVIKDLEQLFSIICRQKIIFNIGEDNKICFTDENKTIQINNKNFNLLRMVVLKQNVIHEPKIFETEEDEYVAKKWKDAMNEMNKNNITGIGELENLISCETSKSYESLNNQNLLQLYADYYRCVNNINSKATIIFKTVSNEIKMINYTDEIISQIYKDPYEGMYIDFDSFIGGLK